MSINPQSNEYQYHKISSGSMFKSYKIYVLKHIPSRHSSLLLMGAWYGMELDGYPAPRAKDIIVKPDCRGTTCHEFFYIWKEVSTGHYIWSPKTNLVEEYKPKFLKDIIKKKKKIYTLLQQAFFALSTRDLGSMKNFYINPLFQEEQGGCWR